MQNGIRMVNTATRLALALLGLSLTGCLTAGASAGGTPCDGLNQIQEFAIDFARELLAAWLF